MSGLNFMAIHRIVGDILLKTIYVNHMVATLPSTEWLYFHNFVMFATNILF